MRLTREQLMWCCGSTRWVDCMMQRAALDPDAADECWSRLVSADWLEAFSHHPRIGEPVGGAEASEQAGAQSAGDSTRARLAAVNRQYEQRFGHIYIICATGKSADEMLATALSRLHNDPAAELRIAAEEQRKIMHLRLEKILNEHN